MKIALAQINSTLGDFSGNRKKISIYCQEAAKNSCDLIVFPESSLFGYPPVDLLERKSIVCAQLLELRRLHLQVPKNLAVLIGAITKNPKKKGKPYHNSAVLLQRGKPLRIYPKTILPVYDVFDESRHIEPNPTRNYFSFSLKGKKILVTVCEDLWVWPQTPSFHRQIYSNNPFLKIKKPYDFIVNLSASPFTINKKHSRHKVAKKTTRHLKKPLLYVNAVGSQDELIFDGGSFVMDEKGHLQAQAKYFSEDLLFVEIPFHGISVKRKKTKNLKTENHLRSALVLGIKDFVNKLGFSHIHLGLSGGIDSALVACLAAEAVGNKNVTGIALPGPFSRPESLELAQQLANHLNIQLFQLKINDIYKQIKLELDQNWGELEFNVTHENIQARLRGLFLMSYGNQYNSLLLNTSNKSELTTGYTTLYGDMCGALCPIGDLLKQQVVSLAKSYNVSQTIIPLEIISRPPSAELRPNQIDADTLPPYDQLDKTVEKLVTKQLAPQNKMEKKILKMLMASEFKRWQAAPVLKVSEHSFGRGRRFPIAHKAWF